MYFNGEYKRTREQNFAGASRLCPGKDELISRAHRERLKRQTEKSNELSAIRIQRSVRGYLCRHRLKEQCCRDIDEWFFNDESGGERQREEIVAEDIQYLATRIHFTSWARLNRTQMEILMKKTLTISRELLNLASQDISWIWRIKVLLIYALKVIEWKLMNIGVDGTVLLMYEALVTFTSPELTTPVTVKKILFYLLNNNYMSVMREFLLHINRRNAIENKEENGTDVELFRESAITMITRPVMLMASMTEDDPQFKGKVVDTLCRMIAAKPNVSNSIKKHVIPLIQSKQSLLLHSAINIFLSYEPDKYVPSALYFFLVIDNDQTAVAKEDQIDYFRLLSMLTRNLIHLIPLSYLPGGEEQNRKTISFPIKKLLRECLNLLNTRKRSQVWKEILYEALKTDDLETVKNNLSCVNHVLLSDHLSIYKFRLINDLNSLEGLLRGIWVILESQYRCEISNPTTLLTLLKRGACLTREEADLMIPLLTVFCLLLHTSLSFITDDDLLKANLILENEIKPFTINELIYIACSLKEVTVGLILIGYPDVSEIFENLVYYKVPTNDSLYNGVIWSKALKECTNVVTEMYYRNERCDLINNAAWYSFFINIPETGVQYYLLRDQLKLLEPFTAKPPTGGNQTNSRDRIVVWYDRAFYVLYTIPFTVPFSKRSRIFWNTLKKQMHEYQNPEVHFLQNVHLKISIRRDYLYEDSFENLSIDNAPELKIALRVRFTNSFNMNEAGVDGGGIFKEFISELLRTAFDPNRGFFILTKDNKLYPNPGVSFIYPDYYAHYYFIGRMLGKAIFEQVTVDLPLAEFFLAEIICAITLCPSLLYSLDKEMYRNICYLRTFKGDYSSLGLDFTTTNNNLDSKEIIELKQDGSRIPVNKENLLEYVYLISKQKLRKDITKQCRSFTEGLTQVLCHRTITSFTPTELQHLISGDQSPIDISEMQKYVVYSGGYSETHGNIKMFWKVFENFTDEEKSQLLKFVTSCPRPPLNGFKELNPPFCITLVNEVYDTLPTASTCMNILKLPLYKDELAMKEKILYAIQSATGFELS